MSAMTPEERAELRRLYGGRNLPWRVEMAPRHDDVLVVVDAAGVDVSSDPAVADAKLIVTAVNVLPDLLDALESAEKERDEARDEMGEARDELGAMRDEIGECYSLNQLGYELRRNDTAKHRAGSELLRWMREAHRERKLSQAHARNALEIATTLQRTCEILGARSFNETDGQPEGAVDAAQRVIRERDEARAEVERLRALVPATREVQS